MSSTANVGDTVAERYRLDAVLGRGGMATVFRAFDVKLNREVAVKLLHTDLARQPQFRIRFRQEAHAAARLTHPNVVRVFDAGESPDPSDSTAVWPYIVMELIEGSLLSDVIRSETVSVERAVTVAREMLSALQYAHDTGLVHRDIKPGNIMLTQSGSVKVVDFGIARSVDEVAESVAQTTNILGSAAYFSPEQARGELADIRSDVYSAGIVLFELLTGRVPFTGDSPVRVAYQHVAEPAPAPSSLNPAVSPALDEVVARALHKNPFERFQRASDFSEALEAAQRGDDISVFEPDVSELFVEQFAVTELTADELELRELVESGSEARVVRRPPVMWLWAGGTLICALVLAVLFWAISLAPSASLASADRTIPSVAGMTTEEATAALKKLDLKPLVVQVTDNTVPAGQAVRTNPGAGEGVTEGDQISLYVSTGKAQVAVPDVQRMTLADAKAALIAAGFLPGTETQVGSGVAAAGTVVSTNPAAGTEVDPGSAIEIRVSNGKVSVPSVLGTALSDASALLGGSDYRLTVQPSPDRSCRLMPNNPVIAQSIGPGDAPQGSSIRLSFCAG